MSEAYRSDPPPALFLAAGAAAAGEVHQLGISTLTFKVTTPNAANLFVLENHFRTGGGPPRHLHYDQEEWFYVLAGTFLFEVGLQRYSLEAGACLLAPRGVPHVWACTGEGRILIAFLPAGKMEAFFRAVTARGEAPAMPPQEAALWRAHGMELLGPPLPLA
jgi:quercetin dioxygenase-like cupin family protein